MANVDMCEHNWPGSGCHECFPTFKGSTEYDSWVVTPTPPKLSVWFGAMPESNGKANFTAILHRGDLSEGHTIERGEHYDRVRYEADKVLWLIGERAEEPWILDYHGDMLWPADWKHPLAEYNKP